MKKLLGGASALALILGLSAPGLAADLSIGPGSASADAISANVEFQDVTNDVDLEDELVDDDALYNGAMLFGDTTFADQDVVVNNFNTGVNGTHQGGIAVSVANPGKGAVAVNFLDQVAANTISVEDEEGIDDDATYNGRMSFGVDTFRRQDVVVNNFNSGWNAAQQGGVAITGTVGNLITP